MTTATSKAERLASSIGALLSPADVAAIFGVTSRTVRRWIETGQFPQPDVRQNARVLRWRPATIEKHIQASQ